MRLSPTFGKHLMPAVSTAAAAIKTASVTAVSPAIKSTAMMAIVVARAGITAPAPSPKPATTRTTGRRILFARPMPATHCCKNKQHHHKHDQEYNG
jgi:hypothetical protein